MSEQRASFFADVRLVMGEALANKGLAPRFGREPEWEIKFTNNATYDESLARLEDHARTIDLP